MMRIWILAGMTALALGGCVSTGMSKDGEGESAQRSAGMAVPQPDPITEPPAEHETGLIMNAPYSETADSGTQTRYTFTDDVVRIETKFEPQAGVRYAVFKDEEGYFGVNFAENQSGALLYGVFSNPPGNEDAWERLTAMGLEDPEQEPAPVDREWVDENALAWPEDGWWPMLVDAPVSYEGDEVTIDWGPCAPNTLCQAMGSNEEDETWEIGEKGLSITSGDRTLWQGESA